MTDRDDQMQIPAERLTDRHVDDAITASDRAEWLRGRRLRRRAAAGKVGSAAWWIGRRLHWFIGNAKDILASMAAVMTMLAVAEAMGWVDLAAVPVWVSSLVAALRDVL